MARLRKKDRGAEAADEVEDAAPAPEADPRRNGPWDSSEKTPDEDESYLDLGPLLIRGHDDLTIQLPADGEDGEIGSVILVTEDSALELRVFAATRSGGLWDEVRTDLAEEVTRLGGESTVVDGPYGAELHIAVPATSPEGEDHRHRRATVVASGDSPRCRSPRSDRRRTPDDRVARRHRRAWGRAAHPP
jgi:hypothetical protein